MSRPDGFLQQRRPRVNDTIDDGGEVVWLTSVGITADSYFYIRVVTQLSLDQSSQGARDQSAVRWVNPGAPALEAMASEFQPQAR